MIWCLFCRTWAPCSHQVNHELLCISKHSRVKCKTMMTQVPMGTAASSAANLQIWTYKHVISWLFKSLEGFCDLPSYTSELTLINVIVCSVYVEKHSTIILCMLKSHQEMTVYRCRKSIIESLVLSSRKAAAGKITVIKVCSPIIRKKKQTKKREFILFILEQTGKPGIFQINKVW